jgi:hypothetical protein
MGAGGVEIERSGKTITLVFEKPAKQRAMGSLHALMLGGVVCVLLYGAVYAILYLDNGGTTALLFLGCAAFGTWNALDPLLEPEYTTVFDLKARTVTLTESGWSTRVRGPASFDDVAELSTKGGYAASMRCAIVFLTLNDGEQWRLGYDYIWVRPATTSNLPAMIKKLRHDTGLPGRHTD